MIKTFLYSFLYSVVMIFLLPLQYRKRPKEFRRRWLREKFGSLASEFRTLASGESPGGPNSKLIWVHAVSVGEVMAAIPFLRRLKERFPSVSFVLSTITDTGQKIALEKAPEGTQVIYLPFDLAFILKTALRNIRPVLFITMETELWPNLIRTLKRKDIPVLIMNGRISDDSFKGYKKIKFFMKDIIERIDLFGMQDHIYAQRIKKLGAPEEKVKVFGSFKFDTKPSEAIPEWTRLLTPPIIVAGSTHRGEEDMILSVFERLKNNFPELTLIIAPRHPERFAEVEELIKKRGLPYTKRSEIPIHPPINSHINRIIILDAMGELSSVYGACDIAVIGGSFIAHGGQNLLEPAYWAKPIICGPHMENFPFAKEFYEKNAAIEADESSLFDRLSELLKSPEQRKATGKKARELYNEKSGAVERAIGEIERYLEHGNF